MIKTQWVVVIQNDGAIWGGFPLLGIPPARNPEVILPAIYNGGMNLIFTG